MGEIEKGEPMVEEPIVEESIEPIPNASGIFRLRMGIFESPFGSLIKLEDIEIRETHAEWLEFEHDEFTINFLLSELHRPSQGLRIERNALTIALNRQDIEEGCYPPSLLYRFVALADPAINDWTDVMKRTICALNETYDESGGVEYVG